MEKKLKFNAFLKGLSVFAFVAFCLLAILAGVTLPFVSNASTLDSAVASAESDYAIASTDNTILLLVLVLLHHFYFLKILFVHPKNLYSLFAP